MGFAKEEKYQALISDCRRMGFEVIKPDINRSQENFAPLGDNKILYGLSNVKGLKKEALTIIKERTAGAYKGLFDFIERTGCGKQTIEALIKAGAFDPESKSRNSLIAISADIRHNLAELGKKEIKLKEANIALEHPESLSPARKEKAEAQKKQAESDIYNIRLKNQNIRIPRGGEDLQQNLKYEKDVLNAYISLHPMDPYENAVYGMTRISQITEPSRNSYDTRTVVGVIKDLRTIRRKKDNRAMASFILEDKTGEIKVICFPSVYDENRNILEEDTVVSVKGQVKLDTGNKENFIVFMSSASKIEAEAKPVILDAGRIPAWQEIVSKYRNDKGRRLIVLFNGRLYDPGIIVSGQILEDNEIEGLACETKRGVNLPKI